VHAPFGQLTDAQWEHLAKTSGRTMPDGRVVLHYDPGMAKPIRSTFAIDTEMWSWWDRITIPVLAVRGENSDLLLPRTFERMAKSGASTHVVKDTGHAPALMDAPTIKVIRDFLLEPDDDAP
jgi:pimeloyl-ACP methyl ester carboxylesterase